MSYTDHRHIEFVTLSAVHSTRWSPGEPRRPPSPRRTPQPIRRRQCATMFAPCVWPRRESSTSSSPSERPDARGDSKQGREGREEGREDADTGARRKERRTKRKKRSNTDEVQKDRTGRKGTRPSFHTRPDSREARAPIGVLGTITIKMCRHVAASRLSTPSQPCFDSGVTDLPLGSDLRARAGTPRYRVGSRARTRSTNLSGCLLHTAVEHIQRDRGSRRVPSARAASVLHAARAFRRKCRDEAAGSISIFMHRSPCPQGARPPTRHSYDPTSRDTQLLILITNQWIPT